MIHENFNVRNQVTSEMQRKEVAVMLIMLTKFESYTCLQTMKNKEITLNSQNNLWQTR